MKSRPPAGAVSSHPPGLFLPRADAGLPFLPRSSMIFMMRPLRSAGSQLHMTTKQDPSLQ